jgi:anti-sigma B factor antagonist
MFSLQAESHKKVTILRLTGDVLLANASEFNSKLEEYMFAPDISQLVIDLSQTGRMDNAALGVLVSLNTKGLGHGRRLVLLMPAPHVVQLLKEALIEGFFPTFDSEEELQGYIPEAAE